MKMTHPFRRLFLPPFSLLAACLVALGALSCSCPEPFPDGPSCYAGYCPCSNPEEVACYPKDAPDGDGEYACRPVVECRGVPTLEDPPPPAPECEVDTDCPAPLDARCAERQCVEGKCGFTIYEGIRLESQKPGDCATVYCSILGEVRELEDPADIPNDGNECTVDLCIAGKPKNEPFDDALPCPESAAGGICVAGHCAACSDVLQVNCSNGQACDGTFCVPATCTNNDQDPDESDFNCGGPCRPCWTGDACNGDDDCASKNCVDAVCQAPTSSDGIPNDSETGMDCGCPSCVKKCEDGEGCTSETDCLSAVCYGGVCQPATCTDATENGDETGEDCGGVCGPCPPAP
jgi:hypothetical protein